MRLRYERCKLGTVQGITSHTPPILYGVLLDDGKIVDVFREEVALLPGQRVAACVLAK